MNLTGEIVTKPPSMSDAVWRHLLDLLAYKEADGVEAELLRVWRGGSTWRARVRYNDIPVRLYWSYRRGRWTPA